MSMNTTPLTMENILEKVDNIRNGQYLVPMDVWHVEFTDGFEVYLTWFRDGDDPDFGTFFGEGFKSATQVLKSTIVPTDLYMAWEPA